jgi:ribosomal protein L24E
MDPSPKKTVNMDAYILYCCNTETKVMFGYIGLPKKNVWIYRETKFQTPLIRENKNEG